MATTAVNRTRGLLITLRKSIAPQNNDDGADGENDGDNDEGEKE